MPCKSVSGIPVTTALTSAVLDRVPLTVPGPGSLPELFTTGVRGLWSVEGLRGKSKCRGFLGAEE